MQVSYGRLIIGLLGGLGGVWIYVNSCWADTVALHDCMSCFLTNSYWVRSLVQEYELA